VAKAFHAVTAAQGSVLKTEMIGNRDQSRLLEHDKVGQRAVDVAAQGAAGFRRGQGAFQPILHKDAGHTVAWLPCSNGGANCHHFARTVGTWNARQLHFGVVKTLHDH
jgi:hypothetical protein